MFRNGDRAWRPSEQGKRMRRACDAARIAPAVSFHILRHTWASLAVMSSMPLMVVAKNLGHRDSRMVEAHYGHLSETFITDEVRAHAPKYGLDISVKPKVTAIR